MHLRHALTRRMRPIRNLLNQIDSKLRDNEWFFFVFELCLSLLLVYLLS